MPVGECLEGRQQAQHAVRVVERVDPRPQLVGHLRRHGQLAPLRAPALQRHGEGAPTILDRVGRLAELGVSLLQRLLRLPHHRRPAGELGLGLRHASQGLEHALETGATLAAEVGERIGLQLG